MNDRASGDFDEFEPGSAGLIASARAPAIPSGSGERIRPPRFAGRYYPSDPVALKEAVRALLPEVPPRSQGPRLLGMLLPHGPLSHVGRVVAAALASGSLEETLVILGPNHAARGPRAAIVAEGGFAVPGRVVPIEERVAESVRALCGLSEAPEVFAEDQAIESLLPLLSAAQPRAAIVPIALHSLTAPMAVRIGASLADAVTSAGGGGGLGGGISIIGTTDLAHYVDPANLDAVCDPILEHAARLDEDALLETVLSRGQAAGPRVEMCGFGALLVAIHALRLLGAKSGIITSRGRSGEVRGERGLEVGYGSIVFPAP